MALIAMAVYDTEENDRTWMTERTLSSLLDVVDLDIHRLIVVDNASCKKTKGLLEHYKKGADLVFEKSMQIITLPENIGTALAINKAWALREPGEHAVKMDNDVVIDTLDWLNILEECVEREPNIGIIGLKRKDCIETPWHENTWYRSELLMLPHEPGQKWLIVEKVNHVMGTCQLYSSACLDTIGYLYQMDELYGFDDALASIRAQIAGFITVHYPSIEIEHIDPGGDAYAEWKKEVSSMAMGKYNALIRAYRLGYVPIYYNEEGKQ